MGTNMCGLSNQTIRLAVAAMILLVGVGDANALTTVGDRSCGQWEGRAQNGYAKLAIESWLMGFLTGLAVGTDKDVLAVPDGASLMLWMDNYCRANPLDTIGTGGKALYLELLARQRR
jgi:hypothetical protein